MLSQTFLAFFDMRGNNLVHMLETTQAIVNCYYMNNTCNRNVSV